MKLRSSTVINKFLGLSIIIIPNLGKKQVRNLNTQNMISFGKLIGVVAKNQHLICVSPHLLVKYMLKSGHNSIFYLSLNHMIIDPCSSLIWLQVVMVNWLWNNMNKMM